MKELIERPADDVVEAKVLFAVTVVEVVVAVIKVEMAVVVVAVPAVDTVRVIWAVSLKGL